MKIQGVYAFLNVCKYGSFTKAAEKTFASQPTISWQIQSLEKDLGHQLICRGKGLHEITLTKAGRLFYPQAEKWVRLWEETQTLLTYGQAEIYRFACTFSLTTIIMASLHAEFGKRSPDCALSLISRTSADIFEGVEHGSLDVGLVAETQPSDRVSVVPFMREETVFSCRKDAPYGDQVRVKDLKVQDFVYRRINSEVDGWRCHWFGSRGKTMAMMDGYSNVLEFMTTPEAWTLLPVSNFQEYRGELRMCRLEETVPQRVFYLVSRYPQQQPYYDNIHDILRELFRGREGFTLLCE